MDKKLVENFVKHAATHNRVLEEEQCWREIKRRHKRDAEKTPDRYQLHQDLEEKAESHRSKDSSKSKTDKGMDAYERELRLEAKKQVELLSARSLPSAAGGPNAKEFWHGLARQQAIKERWGHDGWEQLQKESPATETEIQWQERSKKKRKLDPNLPFKLMVERQKQQIRMELEKQALELERKHRKKLLKLKKLTADLDGKKGKKSKKKALHSLKDTGKKQRSRKVRAFKHQKIKRRRKHRKDSDSSGDSSPSSSSSSSSASSSATSCSSSTSSSSSSSESGSEQGSSSESINSDDEVEWQESTA